MTQTGIYEFILMGENPKEVPSFETLKLSFDDATWILVIISDLTVTFLLIIIDITWNYVKHYQITSRTTRKQCHQGRNNIIDNMTILHHTKKII